MADPASKESPIKAVQMESVTVMKVTRHCAANFPSVVSGFLVGMEVKGVLELTNAYPFPPLETVSNDTHHDSSSAANLAAAAPRAKASITYQNDMIKHLKEVNIDANNVGWYTSCNMGNFVNLNLIENQIFYQKDLNERTVALIHDVSRSAQGAMSLRAFRLSPSFMTAFKEGKFTTESLQKSNLTYKDILIELPVQVHNSYLTNQFLYQLENPQSSSKQPLKLPTTLAEIKKAEKNYFKTPLLPNFASLDLSIDPFLEKSSELLLDSVETHYTELNNYQYYTRQLAREQAKITAWQQKRKAENMVRAASKQTPLPEDEWQRLFKLPQEPSRLETMLNSRQVEQYASQIDGFTATVSTKMFAVKENLAPGGESKAS